MSGFSSFLGTPVSTSAKARSDKLSSNPLKQIATKIKNIMVRMARHLQYKCGVMYACRMPEIHDLWAYLAYQKVCNEHWDAVITTAGPYSTHFIGFRLKKKGITKYWIADWRDLWTENHIYPGIAGFRQIERWLDNTFNQTADIITTVSEPLADKLRARYGNKVEVIFNGFDQDDYSSLPKQRYFQDDTKFRIAYTGTIYPGKQDPTPLFMAIKKLDAAGIVTPDLLEVVFASKLLDVECLAKELGVLPYVRYLGFLPREDALRIQRDANILLFLEFESIEFQGILTGKLFEYLCAGPPILAIGGHQDSSIKKLISKNKNGWAFGKDVYLIEEWLKSCLKHNLLPKTHSSPMSMNEFSRENQASKLINLASGNRGVAKVDNFLRCL